MDMEGALRARLLAAASVTAIAEQHVYWDERPQGGALPDVTLLLVVDNRAQHFSGFQSLLDAWLQVDVRGLSFAQKKALKEAVIATLAPAHTGNGIKFERATEIRSHPANERTDTQFIFRDIVEMTLHYTTA